MKTIIKNTPNLFSPADAEEKAKELRESDPDWTYTVRHDPKGTGYSLIDVYDEDNIFVGTI